MRQYFHIRLIFPFEDKYGTKRPPKDVYSSISAKDCTAKAQAIIEEYKPLMPGGFRAKRYSLNLSSTYILDMRKGVQLFPALMAVLRLPIFMTANNG